MSRPIRNKRATIGNIAAKLDNAFVSSGFEKNFTGTAGTIPVAQTVIESKNQVPTAIDQQPNPIFQSDVTDMNVDAAEENSNVRPWYRGASGVAKKKPSVRQKRIKRNRTLRKLLTPKNALMALYELKGNQLSEYKIVSDEKGFVATVVVNDKTYDGRGISKIASKNNASEKALRDLIIQKMMAVPKNKPATPRQDNENDEDEADSQEGTEAEEVPMMHLASFALHKLFTEWQAEGFEIPDFRNGPTVSVKESVPRVIERSELPLNHETMHPSMLLAVMRPATQYIELGCEGTTPNIIHRVGVEVGGSQFVGEGRSKKLARKAAATQACNMLFNCSFELELPTAANVAPAP